MHLAKVSHFLMWWWLSVCSGCLVLWLLYSRVGSYIAACLVTAVCTDTNTPAVMQCAASEMEIQLQDACERCCEDQQESEGLSARQWFVKNVRRVSRILWPSYLLPRGA